jgi:hypothetical protein
MRLMLLKGYEKYVPDLHRRIEKPLREWCDVLLYAT